MIEQLTLFPIQDIKGDDFESLDDQFEAFHKRNPHILRMLHQLALAVHRRGKKIGMKALWEKLRYEYVVETDDDVYRLNNNYTSRYARLLMETYPELNGFFETRVLRS